MARMKKRVVAGCFAWLAAAMLAANLSAQQQVVQFAQTFYSTTSNPSAVVAADFNSDGILDLAVTNSTANSVSIYLGKGDGTFGARADFPTGAAPAGLVASDFNGDGKLDLAVVNRNANTVSILLGKGDGTFGPKRDFVTGGGPVAVAVGDFNGDGKLDLAVVNHDADTVSILLGNGDGTFGPKTDFLTGQEPNAVVTGDFNGDAKLDLAIVNSLSGTTSILLGKGDGTFGPKTDLTVGTNPLSLVAADFNKDGKLDVAVVNSGSDSVSVFLGKGDGTFGARTDLGTDSTPLALAAADFNGDGKLDLVTVNGGQLVCDYYGCSGPFPTVSLLPGNGDGTFSSRTDVAVDSASSALATADFNGDRNLDLATLDNGNNRLLVLLRNPVVPNLAPVDFGSQVVGTTSAAKTVTVTHEGNPGSASFTIQSVTLSGANAADFAKTSDTCTGATLSPSNTCTIAADFTPSLFASENAALTIADNAAGNPHSVGLTGVGVPPVSFSPPSLAFGSQVVGTSSAAQTATLTYNGDTNPLTISSIAITGPNSTDFSLAASGTTCPFTGGTVAPRGSCTIGVTVTPATAGSKTAFVSVTDNAAGSPHNVPLTGMASAPPPPPPDFSVSASTTSQTITAGQTATFQLSLAGLNGFSGTVTLSCSDPILASSCSLSPSSVTLSGSTPTTVSVSVSTTARSVLTPPVWRLRGPAARVPVLWLLVVSLALLTGALRRRSRVRRRVWAGVAALLLFAALSFGCGGGSSTPPTPSGTPAGSFTVTVTGTGQGANHSTPLNVTIK